MKKTKLFAFGFLMMTLVLAGVTGASAQPPIKTRTAKSNIKRTAVAKPTDEEFLEAFKADGDSKWNLVRQLILRGANVNAVAPESTGWTALHSAAYDRRNDIVALLLQNGANAALLTEDGSNALHVAIIGCECKTAAEQARLVSVINMLAKSNIDFNLADKEGYTPLMTTISFRETDKGTAVVKALLAAGADANFTNRFGENAAYLIKATGRKDAAAQIILSQSAPSSGAITEKFTDEEFLRAVDATNWERVKRMIAAGANVNAKESNDGETALHHAVWDDNFEMVKLLIEKGAIIQSDNNAITPLHRAIIPLRQKPDLETIKFLLDKGADPNALTNDFVPSRPLSQSISMDGTDLAITKLLLQYGADPNLKIDGERNALDEAIYKEKPEAVALFKPLVKDTLAERRKNLPGKFVRTEPNVDIYYEIFGADKSGTPLVVLHGGPGFDHKYFLTNSTFTELAKNRPVIFYDQRGTGFSSPFTVNQHTRVNDQLKDLIILVDHLGYKKFDLMGHSWGGFLAMFYATIFPETLSHLIICDTLAPDFANFDKYSTFEEDYPELFAESRQRRFDYGLSRDPQSLRASLVAYMKMLFRSPEKRDSFVAASNDFTYNAEINLELSIDGREFDLTKDLKKINVPTLIIHGKYDSNISPQVAENVHREIPKSQLLIFNESGHLPFYEEPEKFIQAIESFLSGN